jgi:uncharacterized protein (UPF0332 family)
MATSALDVRKPRDRGVADLPARFCERVLAAFPGRVERIVLFGSRARGEAHDESDWDFAVFLDHEPTQGDKDHLTEVTDPFGLQVQSLMFAGERWLATDELACNIRDHGLIIYGPDQVPMIERPVLEHARDALAKAERFADQAEQASPQAYETIVHNSYYAMFHAARAALLAVEGSASTNHGRVGDAFARMVKRGGLGAAAGSCARTLKQAQRLLAQADYSNKDLTRVGRRLRQRVAPFLVLCRSMVEQAADIKQ